MAAILQLTRVEQTRSATETYLNEVLGPMIDEVRDQLDLLLAHRRSLAVTMQIDRPDEGASVLRKALAGANRANYEGTASSPRFRGSTDLYANADIVVTIDGTVLKSKWGDDIVVLVVKNDDRGDFKPAADDSPMSKRLVPRPVEGEA